MAIQPQDVKTPAGKIPPELFPELKDDAFDDQLTAWIADGESRTTAITDPTKADEAVRLWVYYRAFESAYTKALVTPISSSTDDVGSHAFHMQQIDRLSRLRDQFHNAYLVLVPLPTSTTATATQSSRALRTRPTW